jgi:hypothetical protein
MKRQYFDTKGWRKAMQPLAASDVLCKLEVYLWIPAGKRPRNRNR